MTCGILILNAGSSSLKFALFDAATMAPLLRGEISHINSAPCLIAVEVAGAVRVERHWPGAKNTPYKTVVHNLLDFTQSHAAGVELVAVGHRIVHGGPDHVAPARITPALFDALTALVPLDPLHLPHNLAPARIIAADHPALLQVGCFDTAFHHTMPAVATALALPASFTDKGIRRYGFHGLSYEYISHSLAKTEPDLARGRVIVAHLGAGASLCALLGGKSIATTMGFSSLDGLVMATRCGSIDPGVILYLGRTGHSFADIENLLYYQSGLLGQSGISGDMEVLLASADPAAHAAIDLFTYRAAREVGSLVSALGGLDALIFTAGIGENSPAIRAAICARLEWLGLSLDSGANARGKTRISTPDSRIAVGVIATDEEAMIAHHTQAMAHANIQVAGTVRD